jgi:hypothetical protein
MRYFTAAAAVLVGALIVVHGTIPEHFLVDSTTVALLVLLGAIVALPFLPVVRRYISELNVMRTSIKFREEVEKVAEEAQAAAKAREEVAQRRAVDNGGGRLPGKPPWPVFVDIGQHLYDLIEQDPKLAVAGLGIEVERAIRELVRGVGLDAGRKPIPLGRAVSMLRQSRRIDADEEGLLLHLLRLRNVAVHGGSIGKEDAYRFFSIVESLNDFAVGYSLNLAPNERWETEGLICRFEHCIERMPLRSERWEGSCPVFGHDCPGGTEQVNTCKSQGIEFPASRLAPEGKGAGHRQE